MFHNQETGTYNISVLDNSFKANKKQSRNVFLEGSQPFYQHFSQNSVSKIAPSAPPLYSTGKNEPVEAFGDGKELKSKIYDTLKPLVLFLRFLGIFPIAPNGQVFDVTMHWLGYSLAIFLIVIGWPEWVNEDADNSIVADCKLHNHTEGYGVTRWIMVVPTTRRVIPYCYINTITYILGGAWYLYCDVIGQTATLVAEDFQHALKHIGPSVRIADYRSLWMMLSRIIRDVGNSFGYALTFLCLYLFLIITLTIYGLLSQIQEGFGTKDIGLTITATFAVAVLFFICDEAHYASTCVRSYFQKKILLVELSWMNEDAQQEINMFLRATEMNPTDMCLCGFFDVNRNLFKSLLATMVTYLVVLLQFQISIPGENEGWPDNDFASVMNTTMATLL